MTLETLLTAVRSRSTGIGSHIHGETHWRTVGGFGLALADAEPGADRAVVFLFALLHDTMRENDGHDPQHGPRAAELARALHTEGLLGIREQQVDVLRTACGGHADGEVSSDPTVGVCWDAGRLDLPRVGVTPLPRLLSTRAARETPSRRPGEPPAWEDLHRRLCKGIGVRCR
ncbi:MAG: hypothetical protein WKF65_16190 [Gaiellaceae bacterium]